MLTKLKTLLTSRPAAVALVLALLFFAPQPAAVAQEPDDAPDFELSTCQADSGESTISSQQTVLNAGDFERAGTADRVVITPQGLSLAQNVEQGVYQSGPIRSPLSFTTDIGLAWLANLPDDAAVTVEARLSSDGESWQDWLPVPVEYYPTPNGEYVGSLIWVNQAETYLQIRLILQAGGSGLAPLLEQMTLFFNDTSQGPSSQMARAGSVQNNTPEVPANVCPAKPQVISRTDWGCPTGQASPHWPPSYQPVTHVVINHTATPNTAEDWAAIVRSIWHYHAKILYWGDIGYNYLIDPLGNIYEGRAGGDDAIAAFDGFNRGAMGIGYIGCYGNCEKWWLSNADPSPEMVEAGNDLIAWKVGQNNLDPLGSGEYCQETLPTIVGRSQVTCRGHGAHPENLEELLPDIRLAVQERIEACELPPTDPPIIQSVSPGSGFNNSEVTLTVEGANFQPQESGFSATLVAADGTETQLALGSLQTVTAFEAIVPAGLPPGLYNLVVTNPDGQFDMAVHAYESLPEGSTDTAVRFLPASLQVGVDTTGQMAVEVANVADLFGAELQISFDPTVVEVVDADPGTPGTQVALGSVFEGVDIFNAENSVENGVINFSATRRSPAPAFSGTGSFIQITWRGKTSGQTEVTFNEVKLANADGQPISATIGPPGSIDVGTTVIILRGQVQLQGRSDSSAATITAGGQQLHPDPDGSFEMAIAEADTYSLTMSAPGYLSAEAQGDIPPGATEIDMGSVTLLGGDVTGDDFIDIFDLSFMGSRYGSNNAQADINADGIVDIFDLTMAAANYGQSGPVIAGLDSNLRREIE